MFFTTSPFCSTISSLNHVTFIATSNGLCNCKNYGQYDKCCVLILTHPTQKDNIIMNIKQRFFGRTCINIILGNLNTILIFLSLYVITLLTSNLRVKVHLDMHSHHGLKTRRYFLNHHVWHIIKDSYEILPSTYFPCSL